MPDAQAMPDEKVKRERLTRTERQQRIIDAGLRVFGDRGFRDVSMTDVATECGVTKGLLYEHYSSKEDLYDACVESERAALFESLALAVAESERDPLMDFVKAFFEYTDLNRDRNWILYGEASAAAANEMRARNGEVVAELLERVLGDAITRLDEVRIQLLSSGLVGQGEHLARWWIANPQVPKEVAWRSHHEMAAGAIAAVIGGTGRDA